MKSSMDQTERLDLLIAACDNVSCGLTQDYVSGCLSNKWTKEKILSKVYVDNPNYQHRFLYPNKTVFSGTLMTKTQRFEQDRIDFVLRIEEVYEMIINGIENKGIVKIDVDNYDGHCFCLVKIDDAIEIVDSYTSQNTKRRLSRRPFDIMKFLTFIINPNIQEWNSMFICNEEKLTYNKHGCINFEISF